MLNYDNDSTINDTGRRCSAGPPPQQITQLLVALKTTAQYGLLTLPRMRRKNKHRGTCVSIFMLRHHDWVVWRINGEHCCLRVSWTGL